MNTYQLNTDSLHWHPLVPLTLLPQVPPPRAWMGWPACLGSMGPASVPNKFTRKKNQKTDQGATREKKSKRDRNEKRNMKLTDARLCEELECLLGAREEIPLMVSLLLVLGLII